MNKNIQQRASFDKIRYANCWEDADILLKALNIQSHSRCLSIASAGDNSLALLTANPTLVVALDISEVQLACTEIRKLAFSHLPYEEMLSFLGFTESETDRLITYKQLRNQLPENIRAFWDASPDSIKNGIIHHGKFESFFRLFSQRILPLVHSKKHIRSLILEKSAAERISFYDKTWDNWRWRLMFRLFFSRFVMGRLGRDPEFFRYVEGSVAERILSRAKYALTALSPHANPYIRYILTQNYGTALPYYARREHFETIRNNLDCFVCFQGTTDEAIKKYGNHFDAFNLSDIFEYMDEALFADVAGALLNAASQGARFAYWNLLVHRKISDTFPKRTKYLATLSETLFKQDQAFFYKSFYIDEVL